jgi:hypothetical protein
MYERSLFTAQRAVVLVLSMLCAISGGRARAELASHDSAKQLVEAARALMAGRHYDAACSKLEASEALDPALATQFQLASCYETAGKTASAFRQFRRILTAAGDGDTAELRRIAQQHVHALEPRLSYLVVDTWRGRLIDVRRDGIPIAQAALGTALPLDPGPHIIEASAPGKLNWSTRIVLGQEAARVTVSVPVLQNEAPANLAISQRELDGLLPTNTQTSTSRASSALKRTLAIAVAAVGVGGLATAGVFGLKALVNWNAAKTGCNPNPSCADTEHKLLNDAARSGTVSALALTTGALGLVSGALLWFTDKPAHGETRTALQLGPGAIRVRGWF